MPVTSTGNRFTWLHLSDWHQGGADYDRKVVIDELLKDLDRREKTSGDLALVNAVFFNGDLANRGSAAEFARAHEELLGPVLAKLGLGVDRLFVIPGNHDVNRNLITAAKGAPLTPLKDERSMKEWFADPDARPGLRRPFRDYDAYIEKLGAAGFPSWATTHILPVGNRLVGIMGLNTALMCARNVLSSKEIHDKGFLTFGEPQVRPALEELERADLRIVLMHHTFEWAFDYDRRIVEKLLRDKAHLILQGHEHLPEHEQSARNSDTCVFLHAAALYDQRENSLSQYANGYSYGTVDLDTGRGCVHYRRWTPENTGWTDERHSPRSGKRTLVLRGFKSKTATANRKGGAHKLDKVQKDYLDFTTNHCANVDPRGLSQSITQVTVPLDEVYVTLTAVRETGGTPVIDPHAEEEGRWKGRSTHDDKKGSGILRTSPEQVAIDLSRVLDHGPRTAILGDPGAGKSTLMRFLAGVHARAMTEGRARATDAAGNDYGEARLPLLVRVGEFAHALKEDAQLDLLKFLGDAFSACGHRSATLRPLIEAFLRDGRALVLLDGLDEVTDASDRARIGDRIRAFCDGVGARVPVVATSRIAGYREASLGGGFDTYTLRDMDRNQIAGFLVRWCPAVERKLWPNGSSEDIQHEAQQQIEGLLRAVDESEGVRRLASNPLLLTLLALIFRQEKRIPNRRVELYEKAVETLRETWPIAGGRRRRGSVSSREEKSLLESLAFYMHERYDNGLIPEADARCFLLDALADLRNRAREDADVQSGVDDFLHLTRSHTGLFVERAPGRYGFMHLTFEEYFAAKFLVREPYGAIKRIHALRHQSRWEEPIRLAIASQTPEFATQLIRGAILGHRVPPFRKGLGSSDFEQILHRDFFLAVRCYGDAVDILPELAKDLTDGTLDFCLRDGTGLAPWALHGIAISYVRALAGTSTEESALARLGASVKDDNSEVRQTAVATLGRLGINNDFVVNLLLDALKDQKEIVREAAISALSVTGVANSKVAAALVQALDSDSYGVSRSAAIVLGLLGVNEPNVVDALKSKIRGKNFGVAPFALGSLRMLGEHDDSLTETLLQALNSKTIETRRLAAWGIGLTGTDEPRVVNALLQAMRDRSEEVRYSAALSLNAYNVKDSSLKRVLLEELAGGDGRTRANAAQCLGVVGFRDSEVMDALLSATADKNKDVRGAAIEALGSLGARDSAVVEALLVRSKDHQGVVRWLAVLVLNDLGVNTPEVTETFCAALKDEDELVREAAVEALGASGTRDTRIVGALFAALEDKSSRVQSFAWKALWNLHQDVRAL